MNLSKFKKIMENRAAWHAAIHGLQRVKHDLETKQQQQQNYRARIRGTRVHKAKFWRVPSVVVCAWVGKEFPDMRQNKRRIKFIRVGDTVRTGGQLKGEPTLNRGP